MPQTPCPYCGQPHDTSDAGRCSNCNGLFEPLSQIATQLAMGPWYVRDEDRPFMPGFNEAILRQQVASGRINANTIMRGPTTNQFWMSAGDAPGVSRLMGTCHACHEAVSPKDTVCKHCQADLSLPEDVDQLGLRYTTPQQRAEAQQQITQGRSKPAATPAPKPSPKPSASKVMKGSPLVDPALMQPIEPKREPAQEPVAEDADHDEPNELASALAEDVWHAGPVSPARRRKRQKGVDPLVLGMAVVLLCVIALGGLVILTSGDKNNAAKEDEPTKPAEVQRDIVAVSRVSVPVLTAYERLAQTPVPEAFADRYAEVRRLIDQAQSDKAAKRFNEAYAAYQQLAELVKPLESDIAQWQVNEQAKAQANELRTRATAMRQQAMDAQAERWSAKETQDGQAAWDEAERLFTAGEYAEAGELFAQAESIYLGAENKALAGQVAGNARQALNEAIQSSGSEAYLRRFASEQMDTVLRRRAEADGQLNDQQYAQAEQSYNDALDALVEAQQIAELSVYKKYYAFDAGMRASALMLAAARGDGVDATAQRELAERFESLRIFPNPAAGITPGDDVGFTVAIEPLVNGARDALTQQHGEAVQACYLIGFHASIIDQTLSTNALTDEQQKRIHPSLGTIESAAEKAGWDISKLRPLIESARTANRNAKLKETPEATRGEWKNLLDPMKSRGQAPRLMDPAAFPSNPSDPELFPSRGT